MATGHRFSTGTLRHLQRSSATSNSLTIHHHRSVNGTKFLLDSTRLNLSQSSSSNYSNLITTCRVRSRRSSNSPIATPLSTNTRRYHSNSPTATLPGRRSRCRHRRHRDSNKCSNRIIISLSSTRRVMLHTAEDIIKVITTTPPTPHTAAATTPRTPPRHARRFTGTTKRRRTCCGA